MKFFKNTACPVNCEYCMVTNIDKRSSNWKIKHRYGVNKTLLFINKLPGEKSFDYNKDFLVNEYIGFEGISDCFWEVYKDDMIQLLEDCKKYNSKRFVMVTKWDLTKEHLYRLEPYKDFISIAVSFTGLDKYDIEKTSTKSRLNNIKLLIENGFHCLPLIHPYIHSMTDLSFLKELEELNVKEVSYKGFRFNEKNMPKITNFLKSNNMLAYFNSNEDEILIGEDYLLSNLAKYNLKSIEFRDWIHNAGKKSIKTNLNINKIVEDILFISNISSSEENYELLKSSIIKRRL